MQWGKPQECASLMHYIEKGLRSNHLELETEIGRRQCKWMGIVGAPLDQFKILGIKFWIGRPMDKY